MTPTQSSTPMQVIESVYAAFQRGDVAAILSQVAPNASWREYESLPWGGTYTGPEGAAEFFLKLAAVMQTIALEPRENIVAGNEVFTVGEYEGKSVKTGKTARVRWMFRWRVEGGKIVAWDGHLDSAPLVAIL